jgi:collagenase-like PrtC family protease
LTGERNGKLSLGPVLFNWPPDLWRDFYFRMADEAPVDIVYVGEVVCSKRAPFIQDHLPDVVARLTDAGKQVVLSTLALVMTDKELTALRALATGHDGPVEANDISAVSLLSGQSHVIGPMVNVYNEGTLAYLAANGATRVVLNAELPEAAVAVIAGAARQMGVETEIQVFGRLPLAISARCYHARAHGLHKDGCQFICGEDRDGMDVDTLDGEPFLAVNGTQTLSHTVVYLAAHMTALRERGVGIFRLSPHSCDMVAVADIFRQVLDGHVTADEAIDRTRAIAGSVPFSDGFYRGTVGRTFAGTADMPRA